MSATKRDFERMAEFIRFAPHTSPLEQALCVGFITAMLDELYPKFDAEKFLRACQKRELK
jgi:hypothetical protein